MFDFITKILRKKSGLKNKVTIKKSDRNKKKYKKKDIAKNKKQG